VHVARSILLAELGDRPRAIAALREAVRLSPRDAELRRRLSALEHD
jgi:hypothetical protein